MPRAVRFLCPSGVREKKKRRPSRCVCCEVRGTNGLWQWRRFCLAPFCGWRCAENRGWRKEKKRSTTSALLSLPPVLGRSFFFLGFSLAWVCTQATSKGPTRTILFSFRLFFPPLTEYVNARRPSPLCLGQTRPIARQQLCIFPLFSRSLIKGPWPSTPSRPHGGPKKERPQKDGEKKEDHASGGGGGAVGSRPADTRTSETARVRTVPRSRCWSMPSATASKSRLRNSSSSKRSAAASGE